MTVLDRRGRPLAFGDRVCATPPGSVCGVVAGFEDDGVTEPGVLSGEVIVHLDDGRDFEYPTFVVENGDSACFDLERRGS